MAKGYCRELTEIVVDIEAGKAADYKLFSRLPSRCVSIGFRQTGVCPALAAPYNSHGSYDFSARGFAGKWFVATIATWSSSGPQTMYADGARLLWNELPRSFHARAG